MDVGTLVQLIPELRDGSPTVSPLGGGLTNRNYRIDTAAGSYVLRLAGEETALLGIDRACEVACARAAAELGVGPEVVAYLPEHGAILTRFIHGRVLTIEDIQQPAILRRAVEALRRYHEGPPGAGSFSAFATIGRYYALARERRVRLPANLARALELLAGIEQNWECDEPPCPCHNDLLAGNFIDDGTVVRIIDWEYGGMGDRFFDLGNLSANNEFDGGQERELLGLYFGEVRSDDLRRLRQMRMVSDMREASWGYLQAAISTLEIDFSAYGRKHLDRYLHAAGAAG